MHTSLGQFPQGLQSLGEKRLFSLKHKVIIRSQRCAVEGADEDSLGLIIRVGDNAERPLAQHRPQPPAKHGCLNLFSGLGRLRGFQC